MSGFKAVIEIDNVDDYLRINGHPVKTSNDKLICPYCGSNDVIFSGISPYDISLKDGILVKSQAADMKCAICSLIHPVNKSLLKVGQ